MILEKMADNKDKNIFTGLLDVLRKQKGLDAAPVGSNTVFDAKGATSREDMQQQFLNWQVQKVSNDLYGRPVYFDAERISAYQDYRAMDHSPEVHQALNIMRDECLTPNEFGEILQVYSDQERIKEALKDLFTNKLNANYMLKLWIREMLKYGDHFVQLRIDRDHGVIDVLNLPTAEVQREEGYDEDLGSVRFRWEGAKNIYFEEWQVAHFRLMENSENLPYGLSVLNAARKTWKQLQLAEDSMLVYRLCLAGDTRIKTDNGYKYIRDIRDGDSVVTFNTDKSVEYTKVVHQVNNGKKKVLRVRSKTHELVCTETHPILVHENGVFHYVEAQHLVPKHHQLINADLLQLPVVSKKIDTEFGVRFAMLNEEGRRTFRNMPNGWKLAKEREVAKSTGYVQNRVHQFLYTESKSIPVDIAEVVCEEFGLDKTLLVEHEKGLNKVYESSSIPEYVDADFARLFGFMLGDGFVTKNMIGFAEGTDEWVNQEYSSLLKKYFGKVRYEADKREGKRYGKYVVSSTIAVRIFEGLGYIPGAHNKRIPKWAFQAEPEVRKAMVLGFSDADGCERFTKSKQKSWFSTIEICNKPLLEDLKELWSSLGLSSGHISTRKKKERYVESMGRTMKATTAYSMTISELPLPMYENVWSVEPAGEEEVYDISVESDNHNFITTSFPVHNTRAPDRKVFYVEVGNLDVADIGPYIQAMQKSVKKAPTVDMRNGQREYKYNPQNVTEDYFLPVRGEHHSKIDTLPGASNMSDIADLQYLENKLFCSLVVPKAYLNFSEGLQGGTTLSQSDIRFARTIIGFQEVVLMELRKIAKLHLYILGFKDEYENFTLKLNNPSTQMELMKLEIMKARLEVAKEWHSMDANSFASWTWVMENIMSFSKNDIKKMLMQKKVEKKLFAEIDAAPETYRKTGIFKALDNRYEIAGADPNGGTGSEEGSGEGGGFNASSALDGGGGMDSGMDAGMPDMGADAEAPADQAPPASAGGDSAPDMALGEGRIAKNRLESMVDELFEDDMKEQAEKVILEKEKHAIVDKGTQLVRNTRSLFDVLEKKFGMPSSLDIRRRQNVIREARLVEDNDNPLLRSYNEQVRVHAELVEDVEHIEVVSDDVDAAEDIDEGQINDEADSERQ